MVCTLRHSGIEWRRRPLLPRRPRAQRCFLHRLTGDPQYLERASAAARFLARTAWDAAAHAMPFEIDPAEFAYFFDCGIIVRGLLAVWRTTREDELIDAAAAIGRHMARDFA